MPTVTIAGQSFELVPLSDEDQATYRDYCVLLAAHADHPAARFFARNRGLSREQQQDLLAVERTMPDWSDPPEELVLQWARHPKAVAALARRVLQPEKTGREWEAIIGTEAEAVYARLVDALRAFMNPSDTQIRAHNEALREALGRLRPNPGGWPESEMPQGGEQCTAASQS